MRDFFFSRTHFIINYNYILYIYVCYYTRRNNTYERARNNGAWIFTL